MSCVNFIGHMRVKKVRSVNKKTKKETAKYLPIMLIGPDEEYITKDRSYMLGRFLVKPTMSQIIEAAKHVKEEDE